MNKIKKSLLAMSILVGTCVAPMAALQSYGQEITDAAGNAVDTNAAKSQSSGGGFYEIVFGSGIVGMILWFALFGDGALAIYFALDSAILIKPDKLMPKKLMCTLSAETVSLSPIIYHLIESCRIWSLLFYMVIISLLRFLKKLTKASP